LIVKPSGIKLERVIVKVSGPSMIASPMAVTGIVAVV
jgi:hypothetical protein